MSEYSDKRILELMRGLEDDRLESRISRDDKIEFEPEIMEYILKARINERPVTWRVIEKRLRGIGITVSPTTIKGRFYEEIKARYGTTDYREIVEKEGNYVG